MKRLGAKTRSSAPAPSTATPASGRIQVLYCCTGILLCKRAQQVCQRSSDGEGFVSLIVANCSVKGDEREVIHSRQTRNWHQWVGM
jgi:hypothetical protein